MAEWNQAEEALLVAAFRRGGRREAERLFPDRTSKSLTNRIHVLRRQGKFAASPPRKKRNPKRERRGLYTSGAFAPAGKREYQDPETGITLVGNFCSSNLLDLIARSRRPAASQVPA